MEKKQSTNEVKSNDELTKAGSVPLDKNQGDQIEVKDSSTVGNLDPVTTVKSKSDKTGVTKKTPSAKSEVPKIEKKPTKPPKVEDKPFNEFVENYFIPGLKSSIEEKGVLITEIKLFEGKRPVVGGKCWMVFCELSDQRRFWLCFNKEIITSDKTILLAESNSEPSIVESFLIDEKKTTLALLISRVLQRLNGQKWIGAN